MVRAVALNALDGVGAFFLQLGAFERPQFLVATFPGAKTAKTGPKDGEGVGDLLDLL